MKKIKYLIVLVLTFILFGSNVSAEEKCKYFGNITIPTNDSYLKCIYNVPEIPAATNAAGGLDERLYTYQIQFYAKTQYFGGANSSLSREIEGNHIALVYECVDSSCNAVGYIDSNFQGNIYSDLSRSAFKQFLPVTSFNSEALIYNKSVSTANGCPKYFGWQGEGGQHSIVLSNSKDVEIDGKELKTFELVETSDLIKKTFSGPSTLYAPDIQGLMIINDIDELNQEYYISNFLENDDDGYYSYERVKEYCGNSVGATEYITKSAEDNAHNTVINIQNNGNGTVSDKYSKSCTYYYGVQTNSNCCDSERLTINYEFKVSNGKITNIEYIIDGSSGTTKKNAGNLDDAISYYLKDGKKDELDGFFTIGNVNDINNTFKCGTELYMHRIGNKISDSDGIFTNKSSQISDIATNNEFVKIATTSSQACSFMPVGYETCYKQPTEKTPITEVPYGCVDHTKDKSCGAVYNIPKDIPYFTSLLMNLIKIFTPIVLIIKGIIDLFKAITGNNEQEIEKAKSKFFKRLIPAVLVFLVIVIVQTLFRIIGTRAENNTLVACVNCFLNNNCGDNSEYAEYNIAYCNALKNGETFNISAKDYIKQNSGKSGNSGNSGNSGGSGGSTVTNYSIPGDTADAQTIRNNIVSIGRDLISKHNSEFVYLSPTTRDNLGCFPVLVKENKKCTTGDKGSCSGSSCTHYGGDCNAFTSWVIKNSTNLPTGGKKDSQYVYPNTSSNEWVAVNKYFVKVAKITDAMNNIQGITSNALPGDILGRVCEGDNTHVGIYAGDGKALENCGACSDDSGGSGPLVERSLSRFIRITDKKCTITILRLDTQAYKDYHKSN